VPPNPLTSLPATVSPRFLEEVLTRIRDHGDSRRGSTVAEPTVSIPTTQSDPAIYLHVRVSFPPPSLQPKSPIRNRTFRDAEHISTDD